MELWSKLGDGTKAIVAAMALVVGTITGSWGYAALAAYSGSRVAEAVMIVMVVMAVALILSMIIYRQKGRAQ